MRDITDLSQTVTILPQPAKPATRSFFPMLAILASTLLLCVSERCAAQAFTIEAISLATNGARQVTITTTPSDYYSLLRSDTPAAVTNVIALALGDGSSKHLDDPSGQATAGFYRVRSLPKASSLDLDGDGMTDVFELTNGLNPLDPTDLSADPDHDGFTNLQESQMGTNPNVPNFLSAGGGLIINEIDYDQPGTDTGEFVEILNTSTNPIALDSIFLVFFNGALSPATEYLRIGLSTTGAVLNPGQYLVVCSTNVAVPPWALRVPASLNMIQNGAPDGVALVDNTTRQTIDVLSYEGSIVMAQIPGFPDPINLVEGTALSPAIADSATDPSSLIRWPNGTDSNNAATDWSLTETPTPGAPNVPSFLSSAGGLVINEIDYDQPGTDTGEFVEILNTSTNPIALDSIFLVFFNGVNNPATEYSRVGLSPAGAVLNPGQYLVVCSTNVAVPSWALRVDFPASLNMIQNGAPDGVALVDNITRQTIDVLSYEGSIVMAQILGFPDPINLVEGTPLWPTVADSAGDPGSLIRWPNGTDSNNAATDWSFTENPTPGAPNTP